MESSARVKEGAVLRKGMITKLRRLAPWRCNSKQVDVSLVVGNHRIREAGDSGFPTTTKLEFSLLLQDSLDGCQAVRYGSFGADTCTGDHKVRRILVYCTALMVASRQTTRSLRNISEELNSSFYFESK